MADFFRLLLLREKFPSLAFSNRDIEGVISTAYRYVRRGRGAEQSDGMEKSDRSDGAGDDEQESTEDDRAFPARSENEYAAVRNVLRSIQGNVLNNEDTGIKARLSSTGVNKMLSNKARNKSKNNGFKDSEHLQAVANVDRLFANAVLTEDRPDRNNDPNIVSIKRFSVPFYTSGSFAEVRLTVKESIEHSNRIYSLELDV